VTRPDSLPVHVTPYDRLNWSDAQVEHLLQSGEHARELAAYFGVAEHAELVALAQKAARTLAPPDAPRVYIVPGIMGSQLGLPRRAPLPNDVLWLDPVDISVGQLASLRLSRASEVVPLGIVLYTYLRLKLHLRIAGYAPVCHDYDWRRGVAELGRMLAQRIAADPASRIMIAAHSLGGLVARAALALPGMSRVERVVLLGTPNGGSFAAVQALRGVYAVVRKIARLAQSQSAETLAADIFSSFPSLYQLLPTAQSGQDLDFFDGSSWPSSGPPLDAELLGKARFLEGDLALADGRFAVIAGTGQETVTRATRRKDEFVYTITRHGDGTVPLVCAELPGARTYYTRVAHSELTRDRTVAMAVADLLRSGRTRRLEMKCSRGGRAQARISDTQLRRTHVEKVNWAHLEPEARRIFLQTLNEPPKLELRVPAGARRRR
jgi:pimeloyl-ACP methyl ester carboxylesterase